MKRCLFPILALGVLISGSYPLGAREPQSARPDVSHKTLEEMRPELEKAVKSRENDLTLSVCQRILEIDPEHDEALRQAAIVYLRLENFPQARIFAERAALVMPDDPDTLDILVQALEHDPKAKVSNAYVKTLEHMKDLSTADNPFDRIEDLAVALEKTNQVSRAITAYREVALSSDVELADRMDAFEQIQNLKQERLSHVKLTFSMLHEGAASVLGTELDVAPALGNGWNPGIRVHTNQFDLHEKFRDGNRDVFTDTVAYITKHDYPWILTADLGAQVANETHLRGGWLIKHETDTAVWSLSGSVNTLSQDSVNLIALGGREQTLKANLSTPPGKIWLTDLEMFLRRLDTDQGRLGTGEGFKLGLQRNLLKSVVQLDLRYEWEFGDVHFARDFTGPPPDSLLLPHFSTHRLALLVQAHPLEQLGVQAHASAGYQFGPDVHEYAVGIEALWFFSRDWHCFFGYEYDSAGRTSVANTSSQTLTFGIGRSF